MEISEHVYNGCFSGKKSDKSFREDFRTISIRAGRRRAGLGSLQEYCMFSLHREDQKQVLRKT